MKFFKNRLSVVTKNRVERKIFFRVVRVSRDDGVGILRVKKSDKK